MKRILTIIIYLAPLFSFAQIDTILWQNCLGTENGLNWTYAIEESENGFLFGIELEEDGPGVTNYHGSADAWIVNTDQYGNILWERCYGGSEGDGPNKIIKIDDNNYYLLNHSWSHDGDVLNGREGNFWAVKIGPEGNILWENSYGGSLYGEEVTDAILMPDKGLLMMGRIRSTGGDVTTHYGDMDVWLCRIDSVGNIVWQKTIGNEGMDNGLKIKLSSHNTILFVGAHEVTGGMIDCPDFGYYIYADVWIVEMDLYGKIINQWCYGGRYPDLGYDIIEVEDGYVIAASTRSNDRDVSGFHGTPGVDALDDFWIFKIDFNGNIIWQKCLGGTNWEYPVYLMESKDSGIIIIGNTNSSDGDVTGNHTTEWPGGLDIWVVKLSSDGQLLWEHCFGSSHNNRFWGINSVVKLDDYDYVIGANSEVADGDVSCDLFPNSGTSNAWIFEIKDCSYYLPSPPAILSGPDTLCSSANPVSSYSIDTVQWATGYEWNILPDSAGSILSDSVTSQVTWNPVFEGQVTVQARSINDCGYSAWSESHVTQVYTCMGMEEHGGMGAWGRGGLYIWPNPAKELLNVKVLGLSAGIYYYLSIYDIFGREVDANISSSPRVGGGREVGWHWLINVHKLPQGIYIVVLRDGPMMKSSAKFVVGR
jgi:hypothetical protein